MAKPEFIGQEALTHVAEQVGSQIIMGPAYNDPALLKRLRIKVISGLQYKQTETLLVRKGGTTRRKKVGTPVENKIGFLKERTLVAKLTWNRYKDNIDNYVETPYGTDGKAGGSYPLSTIACEAILKSYAEDLTDNLFFGDMANEDTDKDALSLFDGFHTCVAHDIEAGIISVVNGNLIECGAIEAPTDAHDSTPFDTVMEAYTQLSPKLRKQQLVCYCDVLRGIYIAQGYANKFHGNTKVNYNPDGTFSIPEMPRVTFVPEDVFGKGDRLYFSVPDNFQYGVDSLSNQSFVKVQIGSDEDAQDVIFQIQSIQGARLLNPLASAFAMTNGSLTENVISGDYTNSKLVVTCDSTEGSFTVNGAAYAEPQEFAPNATITLVATANSGYTFAGWSNGATTPTITLVATGMPMAITALFTKNA